MKDLGTLIREAKDHLGQKTVVPANVSKWQQGRKLVSFATKVKGKLDPDLWAAMFPRKARWQKGVLALEFWIDYGPQEQQFFMRSVEGGFELEALGPRCLSRMMTSSMTGCWRQSAMPWRRRSKSRSNSAKWIIFADTVSCNRPTAPMVVSGHRPGTYECPIRRNGLRSVPDECNRRKKEDEPCVFQQQRISLVAGH